MEKVILGLIVLTALVNFIGVLGPELSFDALWYHLTLPRIYLLSHNIRFIPGGLLYYSAMPRLGEMFYTVALRFSDEKLAKFIHFSFGLLAVFFTYKIAREFLNKKFSLLAGLIFYSTLVVGWLSTTAYIDLIRTVFEAGALFFLLKWYKVNMGNKGDKGKINNLFFCSLFLGLAISTKLLALGSVFIFIILIFLKVLLQKEYSVFFTFFYFLLYTLLPVLPWFIWAYQNTGNPIYPIGSGILDIYHNIPSFSFTGFFSDFWNLILRPQDPISPIFLIILPIGVIRLIGQISQISKIGRIGQIWERKRTTLILFLYCFLSYIVWYFTPRTGGGRFILPYLPAWSVLVGVIIFSSGKTIKNILVATVLFISLSHLGYRFMANKKYLPFIFGKQTKAEFLCSNLDFSTNVFYDCDDYFKKNIKREDKVLIYGSHNLYYVNFPFVHESWLKSNEKFNYIMSQNCQLPGKFKNLPLIYENKKTGVKLYKTISGDDDMKI